MKNPSLHFAALAVACALAGCAHRPTTAPQAAAPAATPAEPAKTAATGSTPGMRIVKSRDGRFEGEVWGTPPAGSKFSKLEIGMTMEQVDQLIGAPNTLGRHETGKRWIPFYFGNDAQRLQALYRDEGCLTYTGGNVFGGGGSELIRITVDATGKCNQ